MVEGTLGSHHKAGTTKMSKHNTLSAGIDTGKFKLDVALDGRRERLQVDNSNAGHVALCVWLRRHGVERVGIEASGGYEQAVVRTLRKNALHPAPDPRLAPFAALLTVIEQITEDIARWKTYREMAHEEHIRRFWSEQIADRKRLQGQRLKQLVAVIREHSDLARRLELIASVKGIGLRTAVAILVRMPEIGRVTREQAAAIVGVAPYDEDSGNHVGVRRIEGGRERLRKALYAAALPAAFKWNPRLIAIYKRLIAAGKPHKLALVACVRKLIIFANTVVARGSPWRPQDAAT
jgi:transposase